MTVYYNGVDITDSVRVAECTCTDASRDRADSIDIAFENPAAWDRWNPQIDDTMEVTDSGYTSGKMYIASIMPDGDLYRILATSVPKRMR